MKPNHWDQVTLGCGCLSSLSQWPGTPDPKSLGLARIDIARIEP